MTDDAVLVGTTADRAATPKAAADSASDSGDRWKVRGDNPVVLMVTADDFFAVGERGSDGLVHVPDTETGDVRRVYATIDDVDTAARDSLLFRSYVVNLVVTGDRVAVTARRYECDGDERVWRNIVLGFSCDGRVMRCRRVHTSSIVVAAEGDRVAVAYNRYSSPEQNGLVLLDVHTGGRVASWDPGTDDDRRVEDMAFTGDALTVASHSGKHGYLPDFEGDEQWRIDPTSGRHVGGETVYACPTHVCAASETAAPVTGNTFAESTRDLDARHSDKHTAVGVSIDGGERLWTRGIGGFVYTAVATGLRVFVPSARRFRERGVDRHDIHISGATTGHVRTDDLPGAPAVVAAGGGALAVVEGLVEYYDEDITRGAYRLRTQPIR